MSRAPPERDSIASIACVPLPQTHSPPMPLRPAHICPLCLSSFTALKAGPNGRPNASCPGCGSLERHRLFTLLLSVLDLASANSGRVVLDVAPTPMLASLLKDIATNEYVGIDFNPAADNRTVNLVASLTDVPMPTGSVHLVLCSQVLEHIPQDRKAMLEIARVLGRNGIALVQVPQRLGPTDEDLSITDPDERTRRYGQSDHVRLYGDDFEQRLCDAGLRVTTIRPQDFITPQDISAFGLVSDEKVWICTTPGSTDPFDPQELSERIPATVDAIVRRALDLQSVSLEDVKSELAESERQLRALSAERDRAVKRRDRTVRENQRLKSMFPVRVALGVRKAARRLTTRT